MGRSVKRAIEIFPLGQGTVMLKSAIRPTGKSLELTAGARQSIQTSDGTRDIDVTVVSVEYVVVFKEMRRKVVVFEHNGQEDLNFLVMISC